MKRMLLFFILILCLHYAYADTGSYSVEDTLSFKRINQVVPSSDGNQVVFTVHQLNTSASSKKWEYLLYLKDSQGKVNLLEKTSSSTAVSFSPDNQQIAYLAQGNKFQSLWMMNIFTHKKYKLIEFKNDISSFKWSPDGKKIAFTADDVKKKPLISAALIDVGQDYANTRLYILNVNLKNPPEVVTPDKYSVSQFFVYPGFDWAPDSRSIVFSYQPKPGPAYSLENKIAIVHLKTKNIKNISYSMTHNSTQPSYSFDGKWIAFQSSRSIADVEKTYNIKSNKPSRLLLEIGQTHHICVFNTSSLKTHCLADTANAHSIMLGWNQKSTNVFVLEPYNKTEGPKIYSLDLNSSIPPRLVSKVPGFIEPLTISFNNSHTYIGFSYETVSNAPQAFISRADQFKLDQISHFQVSVRSSLGNMKTIKWMSDGMIIEGLLITPKDYIAKKKYPLFVSIHGGPASAWSKRYVGGCDEYEEWIDPTTCWQNLLSMGFVILQPNPRGSDGYGLAFRLANFADFGGGDYRDVMGGVNYLIQKGIADPNHLAIAGWSYGGYLTAWAITQTNRFKTAIDGDGNTDFISYAGTSRQPLFTDSYLGGAFWNSDALYLQRSPIFFTKNITTPLLIMHGENDLGQVPITQSRELYTALERQKKPVRMLVLPQQGHVPSDAAVVMECIHEIQAWAGKALMK